MRTDYDVKQMNINSKNIVVNLDANYSEKKINSSSKDEIK